MRTSTLLLSISISALIIMTGIAFYQSQRADHFERQWKQKVAAENAEEWSDQVGYHIQFFHELNEVRSGDKNIDALIDFTARRAQLALDGYIQLEPDEFQHRILAYEIGQALAYRNHTPDPDLPQYDLIRSNTFE